jgi:hypothetical protein
MSGVAQPNFFLVGVPKAGTTSLYRYLDQHPSVYMSPIKEPHFFAEEIRVENFDERMRQMSAGRAEALRRYLDGPATEKFSGGPVAAWRDYLKLFANVREERAIGEASPCYLWSSTAAEKIASRFPQAKIVMVLRDPAERAFSQYRHMLSFASREISFSEYLDAGMNEKSTRISETYPFLHFGFYSEQICRYMRRFAAANIHIGFYEDYRADPLRFLAAIYRFLGVDAEFQPDFSVRHMEAKVPRFRVVNRGLKRVGMWNAARGLSATRLQPLLRRAVYRSKGAIAMSAGERARLIAFYRDDIERVSGVLNRDLSTWLR